MIAAWIIYALAVGALISVAAVSAEWALRTSGRPVRFVWVSAIALTLVFTAAAPFRIQPAATAAPQATFALPANIAVTERAPTTLENALANANRLLDALALPVNRALNIANAAPNIVNRSVGVLWLLSAFVALTVLIGVYSRSVRESLRWPRMRVLGKNVRVAPDVGPAVIGMAPPEIVIPRWVLERNEDEQRLVLEHEAEHVRAHDPMLLVFAGVAVALMPWHAVLWFMWTRLRLAVELDCDRRVLQRGVQKPAYGELLVELSSQRPWDSLAMPAFSWGTSHLEKRLVAMTARPARYKVARRVLSGGVVAIALLAACQSELPTAAQIQSMDAASMASRVQKLSDSVVYFVNGKQVATAEAQAIASGDIASIEVLKKSAPAVSEIRMTVISDSIRVANARKVPVVRLAAKRGADSTQRNAFTLRGDTAAPKGDFVLRADNITVRYPTDLDASAPGEPTREALLRARTGGETTVHAVTDSNGVKPVVRMRTSAPCTGDSRVRVRGEAAGSVCDPMIIVDGVRVENGSLSSMNPDRIESIEVIKGASALKMYGEQAVNGVISIKLKK